MTAINQRLGVVLIGCVLAIALACAVVLSAQSEAPTLTDLQKLTLQNLLLARDNAQLRLDAYVKELTVPGYDLVGTGTYVKTPKADTP